MATTTEEDRFLDAREETFLDHAREYEEWRDELMPTPMLQIRNGRLLRDCPRHDFAPDTEPHVRWTGNWKCRACTGVIDAVQRILYDQGVQHGRVP